MGHLKSTRLHHFRAERACTVVFGYDSDGQNTVVRSNVRLSTIGGLYCDAAVQGNTASGIEDPKTVLMHADPPGKERRGSQILESSIHNRPMPPYLTFVDGHLCAVRTDP